MTNEQKLRNIIKHELIDYAECSKTAYPEVFVELIINSIKANPIEPLITERPKIEDFFPKGTILVDVKKEYAKSSIMYRYMTALDMYIDSKTDREILIEFAIYMAKIDSLKGWTAAHLVEDFLNNFTA